LDGFEHVYYNDEIMRLIPGIFYGWQFPHHVIKAVILLILDQFSLLFATTNQRVFKKKNLSFKNKLPSQKFKPSDPISFSTETKKFRSGTTI
jgi:hypothetical protein